MTTLTQVAAKYKVTAKAARGKLRRAGVAKPRGGWKWATVPKKVNDTLKAAA